MIFLDGNVDGNHIPKNVVVKQYLAVVTLPVRLAVVIVIVVMVAVVVVVTVHLV